MTKHDENLNVVQKSHAAANPCHQKEEKKNSSLLPHFTFQWSIVSEQSTVEANA